jgi:tyrosine-protein phosphatase YwqE
LGFLNKIFGNKEAAQNAASFINPVKVELHSHLIHAVDDGVQTLDEAAETLKIFEELGYTKVITTPHVMSDFYKNGPHNLLPKLAELKAHLKEKGINLEMEVAAEYMIDDAFEAKINNNEILSFGGNKKYVLVEMPFLEEARNFKSAIFELQINGFTPILAHPERYTYYHQKKDKYQEIVDKGILLQLNNLSLIGYYSPHVLKAAEGIIEKKLHSFVGSDAHNIKHASIISDKVIQSNLYQKACTSVVLLNNTL